MRIALYSIFATFLVSAMNTETIHEITMKPITPDIIAEYKKTFPDFLKHQETHLSMLRKLPKSTGIFGKLINGAIEAVLSVCGLGNVDLDQARDFLGRTFDDEKALHAAIEKLETDNANVNYLHDVFAQLSAEAVRKKSRSDLTVAMRKVKHARVPSAEKMRDKSAVSDEDFFPFAACQLFAIHMLEHEGSARVKNNPTKKPHFLAQHVQQ